MFIHAVPDNRGKKDGYFCSLVVNYKIVLESQATQLQNSLITSLKMAELI